MIHHSIAMLHCSMVLECVPTSAPTKTLFREISMDMPHMQEVFLNETGDSSLTVGDVYGGYQISCIHP